MTATSPQSPEANGRLPSRRVCWSSAWTSVAAVLIALAVTAAPVQAETLRVFAAASLTDAFGDLAVIFHKEHPGDVVEFNIRNPHSFIVIEVTEKDGKKVKWGGEWGGVTQLSQGGVTRFTLEVGDHLIMEGAPPRDSLDKKILVRKVWRPATDKKPAWEWAGNVR